jgi:hypothetical protein
MNAAEIEQLVRNEIGDSWDVTNHHGVDLRKAVVPPRLAEVFQHRIEGGRDQRFQMARFAALLRIVLAENNVPDKARMELMGHKDPKMTARYTHLSVGYKRQAVASLPQFAKAMEANSQQISQQTLEANVVSFSR